MFLFFTSRWYEATVSAGPWRGIVDLLRRDCLEGSREVPGDDGDINPILDKAERNTQADDSSSIISSQQTHSVKTR